MNGWRQLLNHALFCFCFFLCCHGWALAIGHQMSIGRTGDRNLPSIIIFFSFSCHRYHYHHHHHHWQQASSKYPRVQAKEMSLPLFCHHPGLSLLTAGSDLTGSSHDWFLFLFFFCFSTNVLRCTRRRSTGTGEWEAELDCRRDWIVKQEDWMGIG